MGGALWGTVATNWTEEIGTDSVAKNTVFETTGTIRGVPASSRQVCESWHRLQCKLAPSVPSGWECKLIASVSEAYITSRQKATLRNRFIRLDYRSQTKLSQFSNYKHQIPTNAKSQIQKL